MKTAYKVLLGIGAVGGLIWSAMTTSEQNKEYSELKKLQKLATIVEDWTLQYGDSSDLLRTWNMRHSDLVSKNVVSKSKWVGENRRLAEIHLAYSLEALGGVTNNLFAANAEKVSFTVRAMVEVGASFTSAIDMANLTPPQVNRCKASLEKYINGEPYAYGKEDFKRLLKELEPYGEFELVMPGL